MPEGTKIRKDIEYRKTGYRRLLMNIYEPAGVSKPTPLILYMHGGGWIWGDRRHCQRAGYLLEYGFTVVSIDYSMSYQAPFPAQIQDCKAALRFLRANSAGLNLDTKKVGACGHSAGGHLASLLGTTSGIRDFDTPENAGFSDRIDAVCNYYGPGSITELIRYALNAGADDTIKQGEQLIGGTLKEKMAISEKASPLRHVHSQASPFMIIHGDNDKIVNYSLSVSLHEALVRAGVESHLNIVRGGAHGGNLLETPDMEEKVAYFFNRHIG